MQREIIYLVLLAAIAAAIAGALYLRGNQANKNKEQKDRRCRSFVFSNASLHSPAVKWS